MTPQNSGAFLLIAGCSRRKADTRTPVPALRLYQGGCIPALRQRIARGPAAGQRVRIISAEYGLLHADQPVLPYDRPMNPDRAQQLQQSVGQALRRDFLRDGPPREVLVVAEAVYQLALSHLPALLGGGRVLWIDDPASGWNQAAAVLDDWGWP